MKHLACPAVLRELQAYHDEEVNPTPTHEGRTVVY